MPLHVVTVRWGPNFANTLQLNDKTTYYAATFGLFDGPDQDIILADTVFDAPYDVRARLKERVWQINIAITPPLNSSLYNNAVDALHAAMYWPGPLQVVVERTGPGNRYVTGRCESLKEGPVGTRTFVASMKSADPIFTQDGALVTTTGNTGATPPYTSVTLPTYTGSAPALPVIQLKATIPYGVYAYMRTITIHNPTTRHFYYYPLCVDLGDLTVSGWAGKFNEVGTNPDGVNPRYIRDLRIESPGGARKQIFIRDAGDKGLTWHSDVKVWTVVYSLAPGETKVLNLLYGNANAPYSEVYPESSSVKPMFDMYTSTNTTWYYSDMMPPWQEAQTRAMQWSAFIPGADNITWLSNPNQLFDPPVGGNIPAAGGYCPSHRPAAGAAGMQLAVPVAIASVQFSYKMSTDAKTPFVLRARRPDDRWTDDFMDGSAHAALLALRAPQVAGCINFPTQDANGNPSISRGGSTVAVGDGIAVVQDDGTLARLLVSAVNTSTNTITAANGVLAAPGLAPVLNQVSGTSAFITGQVVYVGYTYVNQNGETLVSPLSSVIISVNGNKIQPTTVGLPTYATAINWYVSPSSGSTALKFSVQNGGSGTNITAFATGAALPGVNSALLGLTTTAAVLNAVQQYFAATATVNYAAGDRPRQIAFVLRGDHPELSSGEWYIGAADTVTLTLDTTETMSMTLGSEVNLVGGGQAQVVGQFGNAATAEYLKVNTILNINDYLQIDCAGRTCLYYHWNGTGYDPPVNRFEALTFLAVNIYWIHIDPALLVNSIDFVAEANSNFRNLAVTVIYPIRWF